ncbi:hypothetical protein Kisp01_68650 [Kineosporia sp. NBRC 101677]|nr:hypothetical protein Kisp01_68650 [Kineosporia sp. NBRC 101677]
MVRSRRECSQVRLSLREIPLEGVSYTAQHTAMHARRLATLFGPSPRASVVYQGRNSGNLVEALLRSPCTAPGRPRNLGGCRDCRSEQLDAGAEQISGQLCGQ